MFSVGYVEDIRWLVHVISFDEGSEGRKNKGSGCGWMESSRDSRRKGRGMEEIPLFCEEITGWWRPRAHAHARDEEPSVRTWTMPAAGPGPKLTGADQGRRRGGAKAGQHANCALAVLAVPPGVDLPETFGSR